MTERNRIKGEVVSSLDSALNKLYTIWDVIGIADDAVKARAETVSLHLTNLLEEMVQEEDSLRQRLQDSISQYLDQVKSICQELKLPVYTTPTSLTMIQKEKDLRMKMEALTREKNNRMAEMNTLKEQDQRLCEILCMTPYYIPSGTVPSKEQIKELEKHVTTLQAQKEKRHADFISTKKSIVKILNELEQDPDSSFQKEVVSEAEESFILSSDNLDKLKALQQQLTTQKAEIKQTCDDLWLSVKSLWDRLDISESERQQFCTGKEGYKSKVLQALREEILRCEQLKLQNIQRFVEGIRKELTEWWDKCFYSADQREHFEMVFTEEEFTEELLGIHERELEKVKDYYQQNRELLDKMAQRESLFKDMLEAEKKARDPNRFNNRGGKLLQEEKARKKIAKDLPKVEETVKAAIAEWEKENARTFLVGGVNYDTYIAEQWQMYEESKVKEKEQRHILRAKQTVEEMHYGSKPTTPVKRRFQQQTPTKTPQNKQRKMNETKTPGSMSRLHHRSVFASPLARAPLSVTKIRSKTETPKQKRRSSRIHRKILSERNKMVKSQVQDQSHMFSRTTVSSGDSAVSGDSSLASTGSYQDFAHGLAPNARPNCRSSCAMILSPKKNLF
ncbi:protein regulator of cytokinesis 1 isoform X1 [Patella vulgata]|uniref:protein regulator of cytokinesis 1 isoform X1 n=1 Tax=Patella vulgata TaxID=6465 RepID=UPI00217F8311|nr:protein regulator of cytokinesis 1 isoform X1 [Patella vulgata]